MSRRGFEDLGRLDAAVFALAVNQEIGLEYIQDTRAKPEKDSAYLEVLEVELLKMGEPSRELLLSLGREWLGMKGPRGVVGQALVNTFGR